MLGKLLKYELKATSRKFLPIYGALILVALVNRLFRLGNIDMGFELSTLVLVGLFIALGVLTLIVTIQRFNKNLLGDEGYLMFTLPVTTKSLITSKLITTIIWSILSGIVGIITFVILLWDSQVIREILTLWPELWTTFVETLRVGFGETVLVITAVPIIGLLSYVEGILMIYLALATGQLPIFAKFRSVSAFISFFVINMALQFIIGFVGNLLPLSIQNSNMMLLLLILGFLVVDIVLFIGINYIISKHLNLE